MQKGERAAIYGAAGHHVVAVSQSCMIVAAMAASPLDVQ